MDNIPSNGHSDRQPGFDDPRRSSCLDEETTTTSRSGLGVTMSREETRSYLMRDRPLGGRWRPARSLVI